MRALITGVTGQDGSYLAEQLDAAGWTICGLVHGQEEPKWSWVARLVPGMRLLQGDLLDQGSLQAALVQAQPDVVFNLGALTFVGSSWGQPVVTTEVTGLGCLRMLEAIRLVNPEIRLVQASTSEMFGNSLEFPLSEMSRLVPASPYAAAKVFAHHITRTYRQSYGMHASTAIMFNHESPRRGPEFLTRKVSRAVAAIAAGDQERLVLGRLDTYRDWGWAPDYMRALPLIAAGDDPGDFVLATGESHSGREWCEAAFAVAGLDCKRYVVSDKQLFRPDDVEYLQGDATRARKLLGWEPQVRFAEIARRMVNHDMEHYGTAGH
jgi:GDPmannose 4,6-dehydratase